MAIYHGAPQLLFYGLFVCSFLMMSIVSMWDVYEIQREKRMDHVQEERKQLVKQMCHEEDLAKTPELHHLLVDDAHGIIYCYVPKVACTNWKGFMALLKNGEPYGSLNNVTKAVHFSNIKQLAHYPKKELKLRLEHYTKFLFVRDPFIRLISAYRSKFEQDNSQFYDRYGRNILRLYGNYSNPPETLAKAKELGVRPLFNDFVKYLVAPETQNRGLDEHWNQIHHLCSPCLIDYDFIGHQETMTQDAEHLMRILMLQNDIKFPPSYENVTTNESLGNWFKEVSLENRRKLYQMYEKDFKLFGYRKPEELIAGLI